MCGRFANAQTIPQYRAAVRDELPDHRDPTPAPDADDYTPSHNVAPQTRCPVVRRELSWERERRLKSLTNPSQDDLKHQLILQTMKWGLVPRFHKKPPSHGEAYRTINARDDTILSPQRSMWHPLLPAQRCVVFVQGFYEWQKRGDGDKVERIPHFVGMTEPGHGRSDKKGLGRRLMPLAGLWERVRFEGEDKPLYTFTIVTTASNRQLGFLHDRMPVILPTTQAISTWLGLDAEPTAESDAKQGKDVDDTWSFEVAKLLRPLQRELECYKVPSEVGKVGNNDPSFILPIEERKDGLKAFFAKQKQAKPDANESLADAAVADRTDTVKGEAEPVSQSSDALMPSSSGDTEALLAAQQAEEEAALAEATARAEQEEADRKMAEQMQRDFEHEQQGGADMQRSESIVNIGESSGSGSTPSSDEVQGDEIGDGFAVPGDQNPTEDGQRKGSKSEKRGSTPTGTPSAKRPRTERDTSPASDVASSTSRPPSSRFSPDPYNPPLSPPRPRGGYSRRLSPSSGGGIHVNPPRRKSRGKPHEPFAQAPPHTWKSPTKKESGPMDALLERQRRLAEQRQADDERAWRHLSPTSGREDGNLRSSSPKRRERGSPKAKGTGAAADIRSFFSPKKAQ